MALSFRSKLLMSHVALVILASGVALFSLNRWLTADLERQLDQRLEEQAQGAITWAAEGGRRHPDKMATRIAHIVDAEVMLLDPHGTVLGTSPGASPTDIGPEIAEVLHGGIGRDSRRRGDEEFHYVAVGGTDGYVLRLAAPLSDVRKTVDAMRRRLLFASTVAIAVAIALGVLAARIASRPLGEMTRTATRLARGDFDVHVEETSTDDFGVLWRALKSLAEQLEARIGELVSERDQLSAILAGMVEGVLVLDRSGRVRVANPAVEAILGVEESPIGRELDVAVPDTELRRHIEASLRGEVDATDLEIGGRRGTAVAVYARPLPEAAGGGVVAVLRDMTALRKLMAMRRDFVANVSHELRTPVTAIQGYAETLLRGATDAETSRQFLEIIHRQSVRIGGLVEQLLALSELEARGADELVREPIPVHPIASHVAEAVRGRATERGVRVRIDVDEGVTAFGDPDGLERALTNLVDNAIKYGKQGGEVCVTGKRDGARVVLAVEDDGAGIGAEHLPRIFERFYRVDPGRSRQHGGAGLGLSIVKHLVESMRGAIEVQSPPGRGARFVMTLPAVAAGTGPRPTMP